MATYQTFQTVGLKEDLTEIITNITPMDTWFTSNTGSGKVSGVYHEWQTDALAAPGANAQVEGASVSDLTVTPTERAGNYCQIVSKTFKVANTNEAVDAAGRKSEIAYQSEKYGKELARDIEYALLINATAASGASGTARQLKGVLGWIATNVTTASATTVDINETHLNDNLQLIWSQGGQPSTLVCGAYQKRKISAFTGNSTRQVQAEDKKAVNVVDVYMSDFGQIAIRLHHIINTTAPGKCIVFGDMGLWEKNFLRGVTRTKEPFAGDAEMFTMRGELTLTSKQEKGAGLISGLKPA